MALPVLCVFSLTYIWNCSQGSSLAKISSRYLSNQGIGLSESICHWDGSLDIGSPQQYYSVRIRNSQDREPSPVLSGVVRQAGKCVPGDAGSLLLPAKLVN